MQGFYCQPVLFLQLFGVLFQGFGHDAMWAVWIYDGDHQIGGCAALDFIEKLLDVAVLGECDDGPIGIAIEGWRLTCNLKRHCFCCARGPVECWGCAFAFTPRKIRAC